MAADIDPDTLTEHVEAFPRYDGDYTGVEGAKPEYMAAQVERFVEAYCDGELDRDTVVQVYTNLPNYLMSEDAEVETFASGGPMAQYWEEFMTWYDELQTVLDIDDAEIMETMFAGEQYGDDPIEEALE